MKKTKDYDQFSTVASNREVDNKHVKHLIKAIRKKNLLHLNPILVDTNLNVIDGQHRLEAARAMEVDIYYMVDSSISKSDIADLNSNKKNWSVMDYINYYTVEKKPGFGVLSKFIANHPAIPVSAVISLLNPFGIRDSENLKKGYVDVSNEAKANEIAGLLKWLRNHYDGAYNGSVIKVIREMYEHPDFKVELFEKKILDQPRSLVKCVGFKQYKEMFLEIYNYKLSKNKVEL
ncbi:hypothetical protein BWD42_04200 [Sphingobacterium sp. CZ-UAM]|uniref:ParB N-terminal domain-containing protein n=1 Tax=Sphingobacterium sp. CZ-UAM TaxID=1933868 RepID=UPI000985995A|nr:ParB N-terminal domain-containing protein [Sphingobacterium sp. CZ-UAM]OOG19157.1 hypothetical protein BWD42_04200 [Sphingobacterium sp. CZ-UAM]